LAPGSYIQYKFAFKVYFRLYSVQPIKILYLLLSSNFSDANNVSVGEWWYIIDISQNRFVRWSVDQSSLCMKTLQICYWEETIVRHWILKFKPASWHRCWNHHADWLGYTHFCNHSENQKTKIWLSKSPSILIRPVECKLRFTDKVRLVRSYCHSIDEIGNAKSIITGILSFILLHLNM